MIFTQKHKRLAYLVRTMLNGISCTISGLESNERIDYISSVAKKQIFLNCVFLAIFFLFLLFFLHYFFFLNNAIQLLFIT